MHCRSGFAALAAVAAVVASSTSASAIDMPARKPGLWEIKMTMEGRSLPPQVVQHCVDATTDKQMSTLGDAMGSKCSKQDVANVSGGLVIDSVCQFGGMSVTSHSEVSGNFDSAYTVKTTSKREGSAVPGLPASGTSHMTIAAKWLGACKSDQKPGDMIMANGMKMNINDAQKLQGLQNLRPPR